MAHFVPGPAQGPSPAPAASTAMPGATVHSNTPRTAVPRGVVDTRSSSHTQTRCAHPELFAHPDTPCTPGELRAPRHAMHTRRALCTQTRHAHLESFAHPDTPCTPRELRAPRHTVHTQIASCTQTRRAHLESFVHPDTPCTPGSGTHTQSTSHTPGALRTPRHPEMSRQELRAARTRLRLFLLLL